MNRNKTTRSHSSERDSSSQRLVFIFLLLTSVLFTPSFSNAAPTTVTIHSLTDGEENEANGSVNLTSSDLELDLDTGLGKNQIVGITFNDIPLVSGVTITNAYIQFTAASDSSASQTLTIWGEDIGDSPSIADTANNISSRVKTSAAISWSVDDTWTAGDRTTAQRTPNLAPIINEILARGDFGYRDEMTFIIDGNGTTRHNVESEEGASFGADEPHLVIEYDAATVTIDTFEDIDGK